MLKSLWRLFFPDYTERILQALRHEDATDGATVPDLRRIMGVYTEFRPTYGTMYAILHRLEKSGKVRSWWREGPSPRRRLYQIV